MKSSQLIFAAVIWIVPPSVASSQGPPVGNAVSLPNDIREDLAMSSPLVKPDPKDDELRKLMKERYIASRDELKWRLEVFCAGPKGGTLESLFESLRRRTRAEMALTDGLEDHIKALERVVTIAKFVSDTNKSRSEQGMFASSDSDWSRYEYLDWRIKLLESKMSRISK